MSSYYDDFLRKYRFKFHDDEKEPNDYPFSSVFERKIHNLNQEQDFMTLDFDKRYGNILK